MCCRCLSIHDSVKVLKLQPVILVELERQALCRRGSRGSQINPTSSLGFKLYFSFTDLCVRLQNSFLNVNLNMHTSTSTTHNSSNKQNWSIKDIRPCSVQVRKVQVKVAKAFLIWQPKHTCMRLGEAHKQH
jgi:hypothetical protein